MNTYYYLWHSHSLTIKPITDNICPTVPAALGMGGSRMMKKTDKSKKEKNNAV